VFCEIDPHTHNIDPRAVERLITPRTSGILGVHLWGNACNTAELTNIASQNGLKLLFDAAHAFGCSGDGRMIGNFGDCEVFSFHATKFLNSGEGGAIVTNDDELALVASRLRNFGFAGKDYAEYTGTNGKMSELSAAMGLTSLESIDTFIAANRLNLDTYHHALADIPGVSLHDVPREGRHNFQYVVVNVDVAEAGISRDELLYVLHANNVFAKRYFFPGCHRLNPYQSNPAHTPLPLNETERLCETVLQLPTGTAISSDEIYAIGDIIRSAVYRSRRPSLAIAGEVSHA
jgi:dTDP-4-amino-4,6-dideoxygalactose transaminase